MHLQSLQLRPGKQIDALTVAALSMQVFLDTYATAGVRPDLAREALSEYSEQAFLGRLADPNRRFILAEMQQGLVGFAEVDAGLRASPVPGLHGIELVRLYVQPQAQRSGLGTALLGESEKLALSTGAPALWLTVWEGNDRALAFYARCGYVAVGATVHAFEGREYANRVVAKLLSAA